MMPGPALASHGNISQAHPASSRRSTCPDQGCAGVPEHVAHGAGHGASVLVDGGVAGVEQPELRRSVGLLLVQILPVGSAPGRREDQLPLP
jgi:hypothetical protein